MTFDRVARAWRRLRSREAGAAEVPEVGWLAAARARMVEEQLAARGIRDARVLAVMRSLPREAFVPAAQRIDAYDDRALEIGSGQTISQPFMVARMTELLALRPPDGTGQPPRVLDVGTGSGYQAAVLALLGARVVSVERDPDLAVAAAQRFAALELPRIEVVVGDGSLGWPEAAPYDGILVGAGAPAVPPPLPEQLAPRGRLVVPVGTRFGQVLHVIERTDEGFVERTSDPCVFVPLVGRWGFPATG